MLRPSVRVTRKVILRFEWTNLKLVRALTLQGKESYSHLSPNFKYGNHLPHWAPRHRSHSLWVASPGFGRRTSSDLPVTGAEKRLLIRPCHVNGWSHGFHTEAPFENWPRRAKIRPFIFLTALMESEHLHQRRVEFLDNWAKRVWVFISP